MTSYKEWSSIETFAVTKPQNVHVDMLQLTNKSIPHTNQTRSLAFQNNFSAYYVVIVILLGAVGIKTCLEECTAKIAIATGRQPGGPPHTHTHTLHLHHVHTINCLPVSNNRSVINYSELHRKVIIA